MRIWPAVAVSSPPTMFSNVVFPHPETPTMETSSPASTCMSTPSRATRGSTPRPTRKDLVTASTMTSSSASLRPRRGAVAQRLQGQVATRPMAANTMSSANIVSTWRKRWAPRAERQPLPGPPQLGDDQHQPCRGEVHPRHVDDPGPAVRQEDPAQDREPAGAERIRRIDEPLGTARATSATMRML